MSSRPLHMRADNDRRDVATRTAWTVWGLGAAFYAFGFFLRVSPSVMVDELMMDFAVTAGAVGGLSASYFYAYAGLQLPIGVMLDRWGSRRSFILAAVLGAGGGVLFASAHTVFAAHVGRLLLGAGSGVAWVGCLKLASLWFPLRRFPLLSGLGLTLGMAGAMLGQAPLAVLVTSVGWRGAMWGAALVAALFAMALARMPADEDAPHFNAPAGPDLVTTSVMAGIRQVMSSRQTWFAALYGSLMTVPMLGFATLWGVPYLVARFGISRPAAGAAASLVLVGWALGAPAYGWWSARSGQRRSLMILGAAVNLATITSAVYLPGLGFVEVAILLFLNGLGSGSMPLCFTVARSHQPAHLAASTFGFANMLVIGLAAVVQPLIGTIMDATWTGGMEGGSRVYELGSHHAGLAVLPAAVSLALVLSVRLRAPENGTTDA